MANTFVVDVNAKYNDKSEEENFRYSINHGDTSAFQIHSENGKITTLKPLDRETTSKYVVCKCIAKYQNVLMLIIFC